MDNKGKLSASYDPKSQALYISFPNHPHTKGCVKVTLPYTDNIVSDFGHDDKIIGMEFLLEEELYIYDLQDIEDNKCQCSEPELFTYRADPDWWTCAICDRRVRVKTPDERAGTYGV